MATDKKLIELQSRSQASGVGDEDLIYVVRVVGGSGIGEYKLTSVELYNFIKSKLDSLSAFLTDVNWGDINGTIAAQTDLQNALNAKADLVGGKLKADQIPLIALHDMIVAAEANITAFIANVGSYTFEQGDEIFLNTANPQRRYHFTGGDNTDVGNYIEKITGDIDWAHILNKVDATTSAKGIVQLVDNANSTSVLLAPTANALRLVKLLVDSVEEDLADFIARTDNPHSVTKAQVGLGNADNTSDMNKPVSTAQQAAIQLLADSFIDFEWDVIIDPKDQTAMTAESYGVYFKDASTITNFKLSSELYQVRYKIGVVGTWTTPVGNVVVAADSYIYLEGGLNTASIGGTITLIGNTN